MNTAARDPEWRQKVYEAQYPLKVGPATDETGEILYPLYSHPEPDYWLGAHKRLATAERHARRLGAVVAG